MPNNPHEQGNVVSNEEFQLKRELESVRSRRGDMIDHQTGLVFPPEHQAEYDQLVAREEGIKEELAKLKKA